MAITKNFSLKKKQQDVAANHIDFSHVSKVPAGDNHDKDILTFKGSMSHLGCETSIAVMQREIDNHTSRNH